MVDINYIVSGLETNLCYILYVGIEMLHSKPRNHVYCMLSLFMPD